MTDQELIMVQDGSIRNLHKILQQKELENAQLRQKLRDLNKQ